MDPAKLDKLGSRTQLTWISWVLEPTEPSSMDFVALVTNPANPASFLFSLINPARLRKLDFTTNLTWGTCSLRSPRLAGLNPAINTREILESYDLKGDSHI